jgi:hypothetical protein
LLKKQQKMEEKLGDTNSEIEREDQINKNFPKRSLPLTCTKLKRNSLQKRLPHSKISKKYHSAQVGSQFLIIIMIVCFIDCF